MKHTLSIVAVLACAAALAGVAPPLLAQPAATSTAPRTAWGAPDLRGVWNGTTITPLQRPEKQDKEFLTEDEARALEAAAAKRNETDAPPAAGDPGTYNQIWFDPGSRWVPSRRTSLMVDPKEGRIPFTAAGLERFRTSNAHYGQGRRAIWTDFDTGERCLTDGVPVNYTGYNNNYQIFQTETHVVIVGEMFGDRRTIFLDGRPRVGIPQWLGISLGRWDGDTLVVETDGLRRQGPLLVGRRVARVTAVAAAGGAVHARRRRNDRLPVHDGRPGDVHAAVDGGVPAVDEPGGARRDRRPPLPVRLPRRELRAAEHHEGLAGGASRRIAAAGGTGAAAVASGDGLRTSRSSRRWTSGSRPCCQRSTRTRTRICSRCPCDRPG